MASTTGVEGPLAGTPERTERTGADRFAVPVHVETHFAWVRTRFAVERTMMAWLRTATSLIAFGFSIFQVLDHLNRSPGVVPADFPEAPRYLCLALIGAGVAACVLAVYQYLTVVHYLWSKNFEPVAGIEEKPHGTPVLPIAVLLFFVGVFAFLAVLLRIR